MPEHVIKTPGGRWMEFKEVVDYLGLTAGQVRRALPLVRRQGHGKGVRYSAEDVAAVAQLWDRLEPLLAPPEGKKPISAEARQEKKGAPIRTD